MRTLTQHRRHDAGGGVLGWLGLLVGRRTGTIRLAGPYLLGLRVRGGRVWEPRPRAFASRKAAGRLARRLYGRRGLAAWAGPAAGGPR